MQADEGIEALGRMRTGNPLAEKLLHDGRAGKQNIVSELLPDAVLEVPADVPDDPCEKDRADQQVEPVEIFPQRWPILPQHHPEIRQPEAPGIARLVLRFIITATYLFSARHRERRCAAPARRATEAYCGVW